jgi:hypothetical protein
MSAIVQNLLQKAQPVFLALGLLVALRWLATAVLGIYARILRPGKNIRKQYGEWAIVTGGKEGSRYRGAETFGVVYGCNDVSIFRMLDMICFST